MAEGRIDKWLSELSVEEKALVCAGQGMWKTNPIPRLGIPALHVSDGPIGVRGLYLGSGPSSACFPNGSALGATWSPALLAEIGAAIGEEARDKHVHVVLGPTINLHRSPLGGRHFESYSEDPLLTARLAVAFVEGVQSQGVGTSPKHFVANDSEFERHTISSEVDERALRELYLLPFEAVVREARPWTVMGAYNRLNGTYCCENRGLLVDLLKGEWEFDGLVVSDWFALRTTEGAGNGGCDLEMPGPPRFFGQALADAVKAGQVPESELDDKVRRVLSVLLRAGADRAPEHAEPRSVDRPAHRALARRAACEAAVLLRNERDVLPLAPRGSMRIAVIGPNARTTSLQGGGSATVSPHYETHALASIREAVGSEVEIVYEPGCTGFRTLPALGPSGMRTPAGEPGFEITFHASLDLSGAPTLTRRTGSANQTFFGEIDPRVDASRFSARLRGTFTPEESGMHRFGLSVAGKARLLVEGELVLDQWSRQPERGKSWFGTGSEEECVELPLDAGRPVEIVLEYSSEGAVLLGGVKVGHLEPHPDDAMERAEAAARAADVAVVVVGLNADWETEGHDKDDMQLPGRQAELVERVAAANPRSVVVVNAGAPLDLACAERAAGLLWVWYGGQEAGRAIADLLFGAAEPGGRLPTTIPRRLDDNPAHAAADPMVYPGKDGRVVYREGLELGYRHYDRHGVEPRFPFGFGLSYTRFELSELTLSKPVVGAGEPLDVELSVRNTGSRAGSEVVQCYVHDVASRLPRPEQELKAFAKVELAPGESTRVVLRLDARALACWDPDAGGWVAEPGEFEVRVGRSSRDLPRRARFRLAEAWGPSRA